MEEEVEDAGVDRNSVVFGPIAQVEGDFDGFSGLHPRTSLKVSENSRSFLRNDGTIINARKAVGAEV
jgi:hypothetical protein